MGPVQSVKSAFVNYFNFSGRATRSEYWWFFLFHIVASTIYMFFLEYFMGFNSIDMFQPGQSIFDSLETFIFDIFLLVPSLAVGARRLHDTGRSGWWQLIFLINTWLILLVGGISLVELILLTMEIPLIWLILLFYWYCREGDKGANRYGDSPFRD